MSLAGQLRESRLKHPLTSYDVAVKQLRAFREVLPITTKNSEFSEIDFESQFRCNSSDGYLAWIDRLLQVRETANSTLFCSHVARLFVGETKLSLVA